MSKSLMRINSSWHKCASCMSRVEYLIVAMQGTDVSHYHLQTIRAKAQGCNILEWHATLFQHSLPAALMSLFLFHLALNLHYALKYVQSIATFSNTLGQLYPEPSEARSLSPLNLPNYASHQLFSLWIAAVSEPYTCSSSPISFSLCVSLMMF